MLEEKKITIEHRKEIEELAHTIFALKQKLDDAER